MIEKTFKFAWIIGIALLLLSSKTYATGDKDFFDSLKNTLYSISNGNDDSVEFTNIPQISCLLEQSIGQENVQALSNRLFKETPSLLLKALNEGGAIFISGFIAHVADAEQAGVWMSKDGRFVAVLLNGGVKLEVFANDPDLAKHPPKEIKGLLDEIAALQPNNQAFQHPVPSLIPSKFVFPKACLAEGVTKTVAKWTAAHLGKACNEHSTFIDTLAVVHPLKEKAFLFKEPITCSADLCPQKQNTYLIAGDYVEIAGDNQNGFACIRYQGKKSTTLGWISKTELQVFDRRELPGFDEIGYIDKVEDTQWMKSMLKLSKIWAGQLPSLNDWKGKWVSNGDSLYYKGNLTIKTQGKFLYAEMDKMTGYNIGSLEAPLHTEGRQAYAIDNEVLCGAFFIHFNNAIYVLDNGYCGGLGVSLNGAYFRK